MDTKHFLISPYPSRPASPWKVEIRASFAGKKIRRFCGSEAEAWAVAEKLVEKIRLRGVGGIGDEAAPISMTMRAACAAFIPRHKAKSGSHRAKVKAACGMLEMKFPLVAVAPAELDAWFSALPGAETSRAGTFRYVRMFFRWAHRMGYVARDPSAVLDAPKAAVGRNILTVDQMRALLDVEMTDWLRVAILLGGFAGVRSEEIRRMEWKDIDCEAGEIHIRPGIMKDSGGFFERIVDFTAPLNRRKKLLKGKGKLIPVVTKTFHLHRAAVARAAGLGEGPANCLRHSFATYHLAVSQDPGKTAYQMGHSSPAMVRRVYAVPARRADGADWWAI